MTKIIKTTSNLLFNEEPLVVNRLAAKVLGLNNAIVIQQIHYWLEINRKAKINFYDERTWTYNTYEDWQKDNFDFWSIATLKRIFKTLFEKNILLKNNYNKHKYDRKLWVTLNYDKLDDLLNEYNNKQVENVEISTEYQSDTMSDSNIVSDCNYAKDQTDTMQNISLTPTIAENTTETSSEISFTTQSEDKPLVVNKNELCLLIEEKTHLLLDSKNKINKVSTWNKDRLIKAIDIFIKKEGQYFSLLEKIYKDDKNFVPNTTRNNGTAVISRFHNINETFRKYKPDELEENLKKVQDEKYNFPDINEGIELDVENKLEKAKRLLAIKRISERTFLEVEDNIIWQDTINEELKKINIEFENKTLSIIDLGI